MKIGNAPDGTEFFANYKDTSSAVKDTYGWYSSRCINIGKERTYYLTTLDSKVSAIQIVVDINMEDYDNVGMRYVFQGEYESLSQQKENIIKGALSDNEEILINSEFQWEVNDDKVKYIINKLSERRNIKHIKIKDGNYDVRIYDVWNNDSKENNPRIFIIDNYKFELVLSMSISMEEQKFFVDFLAIRKLNKATYTLKLRSF